VTLYTELIEIGEVVYICTYVLPVEIEELSKVAYTSLS